MDNDKETEYTHMSNEELIQEYANVIWSKGHRDQPKHREAIEAEMLHRMNSNRNAVLASVVGERMHDLIRVYYPKITNKTSIEQYALADPYTPLFSYFYYPKGEDMISLDWAATSFPPRPVQRDAFIHTIVLEDQISKVAFLPELDRLVVFVR